MIANLLGGPMPDLKTLSKALFLCVALGAAGCGGDDGGGGGGDGGGGGASCDGVAGDVSAYAGKYTGTFGSTDPTAGDWEATIAEDGVVTGSGSGGAFEISGSVCGDGKLNFGATERASGVTSTFKGTIDAQGGVSGTYQSTAGSSGTFSGSRGAAEVDTVLTADGEGAACATVDDCSVILPGNVCGCSCTPVAVSKAEATRWQQRAADLAQSCEEVLECVACPEPVVSCEGGACSAVAG